MSDQAKLEVLEELIDAMGGVGILKRLEARMQAKAGPQAAPAEDQAAPAIVPSEAPLKPEDEQEGDEEELKFRR